MPKNVAAPSAALEALDPELRLLAAVCRRAIGDVAGHGPWQHGENRAKVRAEAIRFLDHICPGWRKHTRT